LSHAPRSNVRSRHDVIVVGAGPTGLAAACLLAHAGRKVAVFERHASLYNLPRAGHIDNEILRVLQGVDCLDEVFEDLFPFIHVPLLGTDGQVLFELTHTHQSPSSFHGGSLYQPVLEGALYRQLQRHDALVTIYQGWTVEGASQNLETVNVRARPTTADGRATETFECDYLIAADGATSPIREALNIPREDFGFNERWLDVDVSYRRACDFGPPAIIGDPSRPHMQIPLGKAHHRFEWHVFPHESYEEFSSPAKAWQLLNKSGVTADDVAIVRQAVYTFEYRLAERWREGRIFLMGDAAHTMPPCLGQGMNSGIRDAANLSWKLDLVLRGLAADAILDTYETERVPHVKAWSDLSLKAGQILCQTDPEKAAARDARFRTGEAPAWRPPPVLTTGLLDIPSQQAGGVAGQLFPQRTVRRGERSGRFDDQVGRGFLLVARDDPTAFLAPGDAAFMKRIGMESVWFSRNDGEAHALVDEAASYETFFAGHGQAAVIVRPDHYVFGGVPQLDQLPFLLDKLRIALATAAAKPSPR